MAHLTARNVPQAVLDVIDEIALQQHRSRNAQVICILEAFVQAHQSQTPVIGEPVSEEYPASSAKSEVTTTELQMLLRRDSRRR